MAVLGLLLLLWALPAWADAESTAFQAASRLLGRRCSVSGCHAGPDAEKGLRLEPAQVYRSTVNVPARTDRRYRLVAPGQPQRSLLYLKLLPPEEGGYHGPRMPLQLSSLNEEELAVIRAWIESFPQDRWPRATEADEKSPRPAKRNFLDAHLINLSTTDPLGGRTFEFRVAHRFKGSVDQAGGENLYGLDTGAWVSFGMAYGISSAWELGLRHTNFQQANEVFVKYAVLQQGEGMPLALALRASYSSLHADGRANRNRYTGQVLLSRRWGEHVSVLLAPTYVTDANYLDDEDHDGTLAVGVGGEVRLTRKLALVGEWIGQISGVKAPHESVSLAVRMSTGRHAFDLVLSNTKAAHTDLFAPGGDLDPGDDFRLGFNITRSFPVGRRHF
ncbi:MAG: hypothetical protein E2P04_03625 [Acidobacteria bacterium]|nr:MAG: hypothetical protein E2P04_03625 [Acidobacteriota bacterium]